MCGDGVCVECSGCGGFGLSLNLLFSSVCSVAGVCVVLGEGGS